MGTVHSRHPTMNCLVVLSCVLAAAQGAAVLPYAGLGYGYAGLGYGYAGLHAVPAVAKSTIKYETHAFEPVDVATPADAVKIELVTKEHEQEILTPTYTYAHAPFYGYAGLPLAAAPEVKEIELPKIELPALSYAGLGYGYPYAGYGLGYGYPYTIPVAAPAEAAAEE